MSKRSAKLRAAARGLVAAALGWTVLAGAGRAGEPAAPPPTDWQITDWTPALGDTVGASGDHALNGGTADHEQRKPGLPSVRLGRGEVRFAPIAGAPGAMVKPDGSPVSVGIGLRPLAPERTPLHDPSDEPRDDGLAEIGNGFSGALSFSESRAGVTQSMSITTPLTGGLDGEDDERGGEVRSMFGLGFGF
jgi:hypothetical protein